MQFSLQSLLNSLFSLLFYIERSFSSIILKEHLVLNLFSFLFVVHFFSILTETKFKS
jgi:hypothetical protein